MRQVWVRVHHVGELRFAHLDQVMEQVEAVWEYETSPLFLALYSIVLQISQCVAQVPNAFTDEDFAELRRHWGDDQMGETIAVVSTLGFFNHWKDKLATVLEPSPLQFAENHLSDTGWTVCKHVAR